MFYRLANSLSYANECKIMGFRGMNNVSFNWKEKVWLSDEKKKSTQVEKISSDLTTFITIQAEKLAKTCWWRRNILYKILNHIKRKAADGHFIKNKTIGYNFTLV